MINASMRGHRPSHERHLQKQVTLKARNTSHGKLPYGKQKIYQTAPTTTMENVVEVFHLETYNYQ